MEDVEESCVLDQTLSTNHCMRPLVLSSRGPVAVAVPESVSSRLAFGALLYGGLSPPPYHENVMIVGTVSERISASRLHEISLYDR